MDDSFATKQDLLDTEQRIKAEVLEAIHDSETRLLTALYGFAESTQKNLLQATRQHGMLEDRFATLESRLLAVEKRLNLPPVA